MRVYKTQDALFFEYYEQPVGLQQVVSIRNSLFEQAIASQQAQNLSSDAIRVKLALESYVKFYQKNPDLRNGIVELLRQIESEGFTIKQFQRASEFLDTVDPEWEVPVFVVMWRKNRSDINQVFGNPICSKCKRELESAGNLLAEFQANHTVGFVSYTDGTASRSMNPVTLSGHDTWAGSICPNCDSIFCPRCLKLGGKDPCPVCHNSVIPAVAKDLPIKQYFISTAQGSNFWARIWRFLKSMGEKSTNNTDGTETPSLNQYNNDKVTFVREIKKQIEFASTGKVNTYMIYRANFAQDAQDFLTKYPASDDTIIIVETPEGNFGKNKGGIYRSSNEEY